MRITASKAHALPFLAIALAISALPSYAAGPSFRFTDGSNIITVDSTGTPAYSGTCTPTTCTTVTSTGPHGSQSLSWVGTMGTFSFSAIAQTRPVLGNQGIDLSLQNARNTGASTATLTAYLSDTGYTLAAPYVLNVTSNFNNALSSKVAYDTFVDATNVPFAGNTVASTLGLITLPATFLSGLSGPTSAAASMTIRITLQLAPGDNFFDDVAFAGSPTAPLTLACASGSANAGTAYTSMLVANGGVPSYTYSVIGTLPNGLNLNPSTGVISGVPSAQGTYGFTAKAVDSSGAPITNTITSNCSISVAAPPTPLSLVCRRTAVRWGLLTTPHWWLRAEPATTSSPLSAHCLPR